MFLLNRKAQINKDRSHSWLNADKGTNTAWGFCFANIASGLSHLCPIDLGIYSQTQLWLNLCLCFNFFSESIILAAFVKMAFCTELHQKIVFPFFCTWHGLLCSCGSFLQPFQPCEQGKKLKRIHWVANIGTALNFLEGRKVRFIFSSYVFFFFALVICSQLPPCS